MANPTTNYGFVLPTSTDLVTDLPADFDVALQGVDTRLKALQPGTTLGDLAYSSATANTNTRLAVGSTGQVLTVAGGVPTWATVTSASGITRIASNTFTNVSSVSFPNNTFSSTYRHYHVLFALSAKSTLSAIQGRFRASGTDNTNNNYETIIDGLGLNGANYNTTGTSTLFTMGFDTDGGRYVQEMSIFYPNETQTTECIGTAYGTDAGPNSAVSQRNSFRFTATNQFDSFTFICASGTFSGDYVVYGWGQ